MACEVAALPFQAHANYGIWSIDFDPYQDEKSTISKMIKVVVSFGNALFRKGGPFCFCKLAYSLFFRESYI